MKQKFIIQNAITKEYWYGYYTNKQWTDDVIEAKLFDDRQYIEDYLESNEYITYGAFLIVIEIYC